MNVPQKVQRATKGSREERAILIRDPNKMIAMAVLSSPKLTVSEIEAFARAGNVGEDCLRVIAFNRAWMKNYNVAAALTRNPKTPVAISMNLLSRLTEKDLRTLSTDRNVADVLRVTARKKLVLNKVTDREAVLLDWLRPSALVPGSSLRLAAASTALRHHRGLAPMTGCRTFRANLAIGMSRVGERIASAMLAAVGCEAPESQAV